MKKKKRYLVWTMLFLLGVVIAAFVTWYRALAPVAPGAAPFYIRYESAQSLSNALRDLRRRALVQNVTAVRFLAVLLRHSTTVGIGTYKVGAGYSARQILNSLSSPVHQLMRLPETNWAARTSRLLEQKQVCTSAEYMDLVRNPAPFKENNDFPLPRTGLEGYLLPDTYDLPPLLGARAVIERQLKAFDKKVYIPLGKPADINRIVTVASLIELEVARNRERPLVAAVIENRLKKHMRLQIDAAVNYALGVWRPLKIKDLREASGPYNLYRHDGLPPGPICSPSLKSIEAAMHPADVKYLYYVALPSGESIFATTWEQHQANIKKRKAALALIARNRRAP